jgi:hypothetical protein
VNARKEADDIPSNLILEPRQMNRKALIKNAVKFERVGTAAFEQIKRRVYINDSLYGVECKPKPTDQKEQSLRLNSALLTTIVAIGIIAETCSATNFRVVFSSLNMAHGM